MGFIDAPRTCCASRGAMQRQRLRPVPRAHGRGGARPRHEVPRHRRCPAWSWWSPTCTATAAASSWRRTTSAGTARAASPATFVQDNHSRSVRGTLRGLHAQVRRPQGKLVRAVEGEMFDVAVDIRRGSPTFGRWVGVRLSGGELPPALHPARLRPRLLRARREVRARRVQVHRALRRRRTRSSIAWNDPDIGIEWPVARARSLSAKDTPRAAPARGAGPAARLAGRSRARRPWPRAATGPRSIRSRSPRRGVPAARPRSRASRSWQAVTPDPQ